MLTTPELPDDIDTRKTALTAERAARQQAEARASGAEAMRAPLPAHLPRERVVVRAERLPVLWRQAGQAGRGRHLDPRGSAAPAVEGDPDAQEV